MIVSTTKLADSVQHHRNWLFPIVALLGVAGGLCGAVPDSWAADPVARDLVAPAGLSWAGPTEGESAVLDFDRDGDFDLVPSRHGRVAWPIMRNNGNGTFTEVFRSTLLDDDRHGCIGADFGSTTGGAPDGRPDIYCVEGACGGGQSCAKENDLVFKLPSGGFSANLSHARRVADIRGRGRDAVADDFNGDGRMDIAVANTSPSFHPTPNRLFLNSASGVFRDVTGSPVNAENRSECVAAGDLTGDGRPELVFCAFTRTVTYRNSNGTFVDATAASSYRDAGSRDIEIVDFNRDGRKDLLIVQATQLRIWLNAPGGLPSSPSYVRAISGSGRDVAIGDVNLDGKPDVYLCTGRIGGRDNQEPDLMLLNDGTGRGFRSIPIPQVTAGDGDKATPIPNWRGSGRAAFLVTNSIFSSRGPTQLIVFSGS